MKVCLINSLKRRNNVVSNLIVGLQMGFDKSPHSCTTIQYKEEKLVDPQKIPNDCDAVLIPYWIGKQAFEVNIADIKKQHPQKPIGLLTGTSPYWEGCPWVDYAPGNRFLDPTNLGENRKNFEALDHFFVVVERPGVRPFNQTEVGMGILPEIRVQPKFQHPMIVLDFLKRGWDEPQYKEAIHYVNDTVKKFPNLRLAIFGQNTFASNLLKVNPSQTFYLPHEFTLFSEIVRIWSQSWALICHNESFGYTLVENFASGNMVFSSPTSEIPSIHPVQPIDKMVSYLKYVESLGDVDRSNYFATNRNIYLEDHPQFTSWESMVWRITKKFESLL